MSREVSNEVTKAPEQTKAEAHPQVTWAADSNRIVSEHSNRRQEQVASSTSSGVAEMMHGVSINMDASAKGPGFSERKAGDSPDSKTIMRSSDEQTTRAAANRLLDNPQNFVRDSSLSDVMGNKPVMEVALRHCQDDFNNLVNKEIPHLAKNGVNVFGSEFLTSSMQKDVDKYADMRLHRTAASPAELDQQRKIIEEGYNAASPDEDMAKKQRSLTKMLDTAIDNGMHVVCMEPAIDKPFHENSGYSLMHTAMQTLPAGQEANFRKLVNKDASVDDHKKAEGEMRAQLLQAHMNPQDVDRAMSTLAQARDAGMDFSKEAIPPRPTSEDNPWHAEKIRLRNESMASTVGDYMKAHPGSRALIATGYDHAGSSKPEDANDQARNSNPAYGERTVNELLSQNYGLSSAAVLLAGAKSRIKELNGPDRGVNNNGFFDAVIDHNLQHHEVAIKTKGQFDALVFVPQE